MALTRILSVSTDDMIDQMCKIHTWNGADGNVYEWDPIGNILYDINTGLFLGDKDEYEDYLNRVERVEDWIAPNGKTYKFDPETNDIYDNECQINLGNKDDFERGIKEEIEEEERERYEREPHILIDNWGGPMIDVRNAGPSTDFVVNELVHNLIRLRKISSDRAKILRAFVSCNHV